MNPIDEIYHRLFKLRYGKPEYNKVTSIQVEPELFVAAYTEMSHICAVHKDRGFRMPVPEREYEMWGVVVVKAV